MPTLAGTLLAEGWRHPPPKLHFGRAAVTRLRTLTRRKAADPDTGLEFVDRVLLPQQGVAARPVLRGCVDFSILLLLTLGLLAAVNSAFSLALPAWIWPGAAALCACCGWRCAMRRCLPLPSAGLCWRWPWGIWCCCFGAAGLPARHGCLCQRREAMLEYTFQRGFCRG